MTAIMPTGVRKPKQKASVEGTVGKIATAIIAKLRNEDFYSFEDLKAAVSKKLKEFNHQSFQKREGNRYQSWQEEKNYLHPLPDLPFEIATWYKDRTVNLDYHVISCCLDTALKYVPLVVVSRPVVGDVSVIVLSVARHI